LIPLEGGTAETRYQIEPVDERSPDKLFQHRWAVTLLERVFERLRQEYEAEGKADLFGELQGCLAQARAAVPYAEVAALFPRLEILECLGCGGMGAVYKARQARLDRLVALKILNCDRENATRAGRFAARFEREARALAKLSHPNIVATHEFGQAGGMPYFIMEYVDGLNVRQLEQSRKLTPREALEIIPQICEALQYAHDQGIVHRDIKPANILIDKKGRVKIADFGIAKMLVEAAPPLAPSADNAASAGAEGRIEGANLTQDQVLGTPHYMAPEQVEQPQTVDHRADIYSLGVVFYEMLTGELPLGKFQPPSRKVQIDVRLDEIVLHTLEKQPERRYQHASDVRTDVENVAGTPPPEGVATEHGSKSVVWSDVLGSLWALAAVVLLVGRKVARTEPLMYSFFDVGGWFYPSSYHLLVAGCLGLALACLVIPRLCRHTGRRERTGHGQTVSTAALGDQALAAVRNQVKLPAIGVFAAGCLNLAMIAGVLIKFIMATAAESPDRPMMLFFSPPLLAMLFISGVIIAGARLMERVANYRLAVTASVLAILVPPGAVVGLPFGIWSRTRGFLELFGSRCGRSLSGSRQGPNRETAWSILRLVAGAKARMAPAEWY